MSNSPTLTETKAANELFFREVVGAPALRDVKTNLEFGTEHVGLSQHNAVLILTKNDWTLPTPKGHSRSLNIHFEARRRNEFRLEVEIAPWTWGQDRMRQLASRFEPELSRRTSLIDALRNRITTNPFQFFSIDERRMRPSNDYTAANITIIKFVGGLPEQPTVEQAATFFGDVMKAVTPIVDNVCRGYRD